MLVVSVATLGTYGIFPNLGVVARRSLSAPVEFTQMLLGESELDVFRSDS